jgi:hypothetical protein
VARLGAIVSAEFWPTPREVGPVTDRTALITSFLAAAGWADAARSRLTDDASFRRYERLRRGGETVVLMDAPPPESVRPFVAVAALLRKHGLSAPQVLAAEEAAGLLLLEDFGDDTYTRLLAKGADEAALYALAIDVVVALHQRVTPAELAALPPFDDARALENVRRFLDWTWPALFDAEADAAVRDAFFEAWRTVLPLRHAAPERMALFDYHVDNLMVLPGREGIAACGLLDFQDAVRAPAPFDLVSLIEDARRDLAPGLAESLRERYLAAFPALDRDGFDQSYAVIGAQRATRILGNFARLWRRDGKPGYLVHVPRLWRHLEGGLLHPALAPLREWFDRHVPPEARRAPLGPRSAA